MEFINDPVKSKRVFILMLSLTIFFFLVGGALGYLYYQKFKNYQSLKSENENLKNQIASSSEELKKEIEGLQKDKTALEKENKTLTDQAASDKTKDAKIKAYNDFFKYLNSVIEVHNGFNGWTDAEYQAGRKYAQATGDNNFVSLIDWAWNRKDIDQTTRVIAVWKAIAAGIEGNL